MRWTPCVLATLVFSGAACAAEPAATPLKGATDKWKLVWADEFDHDGLPDPAKWTYEKGFVRNHEPQYYMAGRLENARVEKGHLILEARKEHLPNPDYKPGATGKAAGHPEFLEYTSASIITQNLFNFQYGRVEFRAKLPTGQGTWPAIWTLGQNHREAGWPGCGEIDILEWWGHNPKMMTSTLHDSVAGHYKNDHGELPLPEPRDGFHNYAFEWYPDHMDFFVDDKTYHHVDLSKFDDRGANAFRKPHYILIDFALDPPGHNHKIDAAALPAQFVVDYIRVYQLK